MMAPEAPTETIDAGVSASDSNDPPSPAQPANHINRAKPSAPNEVFETAARQEKSDRIHREMSCVSVQEGGRKQSIPVTELQNEIWHQSTKGHQGEARQFKQIGPWTDTVDELGREYAGQTPPIAALTTGKDGFGIATTGGAKSASDGRGSARSFSMNRYKRRS